MKKRQITKERIDELLRFLPIFEDVEQRFIRRWTSTEPNSDGVRSFPHPIYRSDVQDFFRLAGQPWWCGTDVDYARVATMLNDDAAVESSDLEEVRSMLTFCVRGERFCDGHWDSVLASGRVQAVLRRLRDLRETL